MVQLFAFDFTNLGNKWTAAGQKSSEQFLS